MNPRDIVKKTLEFDSPERIPRQMWLLPYAENVYPGEAARIQRMFPDDIVNAPADFTQQPEKNGDLYEPGTHVDEWGCIFESKQRGYIGEVKKPAPCRLERCGQNHTARWNARFRP